MLCGVHMHVCQESVECTALLYSDGLLCVSCHANLASKVSLVFLNWSAPCCIRVAYQNTQTAMAGYVSSEDNQSLHVTMTPTFCWNKGQLWLTQQQCMKLMAQQALNLDRAFFIPLNETSDTRESRPLNLPGRLGVPMVIPESLKSYVWKNCALLKLGRTAPANQLKLNEMVDADTMDADALPPSNKASDALSHHHGPQGPKRYDQIGCDAASKLLDATVDGLTFPSRGAWLLVDLMPNAGEMLEAFLHKRLGTTNPGFYFGVCGDEAALEWTKLHLVERMALLVTEKKLTIPGLAAPEKEMPTNLKESPPPEPELTLLVKDAETMKLTVPQAVMKKWGLHDTYSSQLSELLEKSRQLLGYEEPMQVTTNAETPDKKRKAGTAEETPAAGGPSAKKPKLQESDCVDNSEAPGPWLMETKLSNLRGEARLPLSFLIKIAIGSSAAKPVATWCSCWECDLLCLMICMPIACCVHAVHASSVQHVLSVCKARRQCHIVDMLVGCLCYSFSGLPDASCSLKLLCRHTSGLPWATVRPSRTLEIQQRL